jgi:L-lactate dehydrogenase complex protein LldF
MTDPFRTQIRLALANPSLQAALDGNARRRLSARLQAFASLPEDLEVMRQRAHAMRAEVITNLDHYLEKFIANAQANGLIVHRAANGEQAVQMVREIAQRVQARVISKSKTMVGEEIRINHALEEDGLQVVETDLGEYIVQLRGEPPAHIITPAVHLSRSQVGQTFHEKLGVPFTDDIPTLTTIARRVLRQTFLDTNIGISGVNFGVVESGTLCLVTNEGNGRMVTTLPPVHIALMGIERLAPTLDDLALMLYLLPRSATGQKLSVYTSLIHGPRRAGETEGPLERHLILVDNGRSALRTSPLAEVLCCIRCGACLNVCPVFRQIGGHAYVGVSGRITPYPGPIGSVVSPGLFGAAEFGQLARASSLCGACKEACPVDIDLPGLLLRVRAGQGTSPQAPVHVPGGLKLGLRLYSWAAASPWRFEAAQRLAGTFGQLFSPWLRLPPFTGWGLARDFPRPAARPFHASFKREMQASQAASQPSYAPVPVHPASRPSVLPVSLLSRFESELAELGGHFTHCMPDDLARHVVETLQSRGIRAVQAWDEEDLPPGLLAALRTAGVQVSLKPDPNLRAGLTGALAGIAETGTLVLAAGAGRPLSASLLPEIHLAILRVGDILEKLPQVLNLPKVREASAVALISGPSRTGDIEMTLTIGVHGPGEVHVFCLE